VVETANYETKFKKLASENEEEFAFVIAVQSFK
jgi:hypothetical protein